MVSGLQCGVILVREVDGKTVIDRADPIVMVHMNLLLSGLFTATNDDHLLVAGEIRYRPVGFSDCRALICQRIDPE